VKISGTVYTTHEKKIHVTLAEDTLEKDQSIENNCTLEKDQTNLFETISRTKYLE